MSAEMFLASDGSWGDATGLRLIPVTDEQVATMSEMDADDVPAFLNSLDGAL